MKLKYTYKILSLVAAFLSGACVFNELPLQGIVMGVTSIVFVVVDSKQ